MRLGLASLLGLAAALAGCGSGSNEAATTAQAGAAQTIAIGESEFKLDPASMHLDQTGNVTFRITNSGKVDHALEIEGEGVEEETEAIKPGGSADLTVDLAADGSYEIYCPLDGHRDLGMEGTLTVGAGGAGTGTTEDEETTTSDDGYGYGSG
jgi:plastocyanin